MNPRVVRLIYEVTNIDNELWADADVSIYFTNVKNRVIEETQPWKIRIRGNPEPFGYIAIEGYEIGVLISYGAYNDVGWATVDKYMNILFELFRNNGIILVPYSGEPKAITPNQIEIEYKSNQELSQEDQARMDIGNQMLKKECEELLPKKKTARKNWKKIYNEIIIIRNEYHSAFTKNESEYINPTIREFQAKLLKKFTKVPDRKTLGKIIDAGDKGCLKLINKKS